MQYFQTLVTTESKKIKYQLLIATITLFTLVSLVFTLMQNKPFLLEKIMSEQRSAQTILLDFTRMSIDSEEAKENELYLNLVKQSDLLAKEEMALRFEKNDTLAESAIKLSKVRNDFYHLKADISDYSKYIPASNENHLEAALYKTLLNQNQPIYSENNNLVMATIVFLGLLSLIWFPLAALIASDSLLEDINHLSINSGFPISFRKKISSKMTFMLLFFLQAILIVPIVIMILSIFFASGNWHYPVAVFLNNYVTIPIWQYLTLHLLSYLLIGLFISLLSILINYLVNDLYITMFINFAIYLLPNFFPEIIKKLWFFPAIYLNPTTALSGQFLSNQFFGSFLCGVIVLIIWCILILLLLSRLLTSQGLRERRQ